MGNPDLFSIYVHWNHWALPLAVTFSLRSQEFNVTIGPVMFSTCWGALSKARGEAQ